MTLWFYQRVAAVILEGELGQRALQPDTQAQQATRQREVREGPGVSPGPVVVIMLKFLEKAF